MLRGKASCQATRTDNEILIQYQDRFGRHLRDKRVDGAMPYCQLRYRQANNDVGYRPRLSVTVLAYATPAPASLVLNLRSTSPAASPAAQVAPDPLLIAWVASSA